MLSAAILILRTLSVVPLVAWPFLLIANVMSLAAPGGNSLVAKLFLWGTTIYPLIFFAALLWGYKLRNAGDQNGELLAALMPLGYCAVMGLFFALWQRVG